MCSFTINYNSLRYGKSTRIPRVIQPFSRNVLSDVGKIAVSLALGITTKAIKKQNIRFDNDNDGRGSYPFVRISYDKFKKYNGDGYKAVRHGLNQAEKLGIIKLHKPNYFTRTIKIEFVSFTRHFQNANSHVSKTQSSNITNNHITNVSLKHKDTRIKDTRNVRNARKPAKLARPNLDKNVRVAKLNAQTERIKHQQNVNATNKLAKNTARAIHSPKTVRKIKEWSFNDPSRFKYYTGLMYAGKRWATYNFKHQKDMNHEDYKFLSWGLQFEYNDAYKTNDFANEISDVITYTHSLPASQIKTTKYKYMRGWFTRIFMRYAEQYCNTHNPIRVAERKNEPDIPIGLSLSGSSADDDDVSSQIDYLDDQHVKLHPTSPKLQAKIKKQLKGLGEE